jgi:hypothetical protein
MRTETIPFRDFMDGSYKKQQPSINYLPIAFTMNEPTKFLVTMLGVGLVILIAEEFVKDKDFADKFAIFRNRYIRYVFPACVVVTGFYVFVKIVHLLL